MSKDFEIITAEDIIRLRSECTRNGFLDSEGFAEEINKLITEQGQVYYPGLTMNGTLMMDLRKAEYSSNEALVFTRLIEEEKAECDHLIDLNFNECELGRYHAKFLNFEFCPMCGDSLNVR